MTDLMPAEVMLSVAVFFTCYFPSVVQTDGYSGCSASDCRSHHVICRTSSQ